MALTFTISRRFSRTCRTLGLCAILAAPASAGGIEDFEHGDMGRYALATRGANLTATTGAAFDGAFGMHAGPGPAGWHLRTDVPTAPGTITRAYVRMNSANSRFHLGVGASAAGAFSAVIAMDTGELILQDNTGFGFVELEAKYASLVPGKWYRLELGWEADGGMWVQMRETDGTFAGRTEFVFTQKTAPGGLALRGFGDVDCDSIASTTLCPDGEGEDFEHGDLGLFTASGPNATTAITPAAARDGALGLELAAPVNPFHFRTDVCTFPGSVTRAFVRSQFASGRVHLGASAGSDGAFGAVLDFDAGELRLEDHAGYGSVAIGTVPAALAAGTWYQLEISWAPHGAATVSVYDESGSTVLATTGELALGATDSGGLAFSGFATTGRNHVDTVTIRPLLEDFEHGDTSRYVNNGGGGVNFFFTPAAARSGALGIEFLGFPRVLYRSDVMTSPATGVRADVRLGEVSGPENGVVAISLAETSLAANFAVLDSFHDALRLTYESSSGGEIVLAETPFNATADTWYQLEILQAGNGDLQANLWDESGSALLASTGFYYNTNLAPGLVSLYGSGQGTQMDSLRVAQCATTRREVTYCTAKRNSLGCVPRIGFNGRPSATPPLLVNDQFTVWCENVRNRKFGLLFYSVNTPPAAAPFQGGTLCLSAPVKRTNAISSFGAPLPADDCSGRFSIHMNAWAHGTAGNPSPALLVPGNTVNCQWWGRDPGYAPPDDTQLSNALNYEINP